MRYAIAMTSLSFMVLYAACSAPQETPSADEESSSDETTSPEVQEGASRARKATPLDVPAECRGAALDLNPLLDANICAATGGKAVAFADTGLVSSAAPAPIRIKSGSKSTLTLTLSNSKAEPVVFDLISACGEFFGYIITDPEGKQVDGGCNARRRCVSSRARFAIEGNGKAMFEVPVSAVVREWSSQCEVVNETPLEKATYLVRIHTPITEPSGTSTLHVE